MTAPRRERRLVEGATNHHLEITGLPDDWHEHLELSEVRSFMRAASQVPNAGPDRVQRLILHAVRIRRGMSERHGPEWWRAISGW